MGFEGLNFDSNSYYIYDKKVHFYFNYNQKKELDLFIKFLKQQKETNYKKLNLVLKEGKSNNEFKEFYYIILEVIIKKDSNKLNFKIEYSEYSGNTENKYQEELNITKECNKINKEAIKLLTIELNNQREKIKKLKLEKRKERYERKTESSSSIKAISRLHSRFSKSK